MLPREFWDCYGNHTAPLAMPWKGSLTPEASTSHLKLLLRSLSTREWKVLRTLNSHRRLLQLEASPSEQRRERGLLATEALLSLGQLLLE